MKNTRQLIYYMSPSKTMKNEALEALPEGPFLISSKYSHLLRKQLIQHDREALMTFYDVSEKVATHAFDLLRIKETGKSIDLFEGLVYKNLDYRSLEEHQRGYIDEFVKIGSAMYGIVHANQHLKPYRLDLDNPIHMNGQTLTQFWSKKVTDVLLKDEAEFIINVSSEEYSALLDLSRLRRKKHVIRIEFREFKDGKLKNGATYAKMARGQFIRQMAINNVMNTEELKAITVLGYRFNEIYSNEHHYFFIK